MPDGRLERTRRAYRLDFEPEGAGVPPYTGNLDELFSSHLARLWRDHEEVDRRIVPLLREQYDGFK